MHIRYYSDLHLEFPGPPRIAPADPEVVIALAGDIHTRNRGFQWARSIWERNDIIYVLGNHEHYHSDYNETCRTAQAEADSYGIHLLNPGTLRISGVRFIGATLWTDFNVLHTANAAMDIANEAMSDFAGAVLCENGAYGRFRAENALEAHRRELRFIRTELAAPFIGKTVVITHHAPHRRASAPKFWADLLAPCFCSDLTSLMSPPVDFWVSGHTHWCSDLTLPTGTRWLSNQGGYPGEHSCRMRFDPAAEFEIVA